MREEESYQVIPLLLRVRGSQKHPTSHWESRCMIQGERSQAESPPVPDQLLPYRDKGRRRERRGKEENEGGSRS